MDSRELRSSDSVVDLCDALLTGDQNEVALMCISLKTSAGVSQEVFQQAVQLDDAGYDVTVFVLEGGMDLPDGVDLEVLGLNTRNYVKQFHQLLYPAKVSTMFEYSRRLGEFDLTISHRYPLSALSYLAKRRFGTPYVLWHYHIPEMAAMDSIPVKVWVRLLSYFEEESFLVRNADVVCSISDSSREELHNKSGVDSLVIHNNAEEHRFDGVSPDYQAIKDNYGVEQSDPIVLFVGRITTTKNVHDLVTMFDEVQAEIPDAHLVIVGEPSRDDYLERVKRLAGENVVFTGFASDEELVALYESADVFATASLREGRNLPPAEAQTFGTPVVGFDVPGIRDVVDFGTLVEPRNQQEFSRQLKNELSQANSGD